MPNSLDLFLLGVQSPNSSITPIIKFVTPGYDFYTNVYGGYCLMNGEEQLIPEVECGVPGGEYEDGEWINTEFWCSYTEFMFDNKLIRGVLNKAPNIKESIDIETKRYKVGNVSITLHNEEKLYDPTSNTRKEKLSSSLYGKYISINSSVHIYYKVSGVETLDDLYPVYVGRIRDIKHDTNSIALSIEDSSQEDFHRKVPISRTTGDNPEVIPMVYGNMKKSPCILQKTDNNGIIENAKLIFDKIDGSYSYELNTTTDSNNFLQTDHISVSQFYKYFQSRIYVESDGRYLPISLLSTGLNESGQIYGFGNLANNSAYGDIRHFKEYLAGDSFVEFNLVNAGDNDSPNNNLSSGAMNILYLNKPVGYTFHRYSPEPIQDVDNQSNNINYDNSDLPGYWHLNDGTMISTAQEIYPFGGSSMVDGDSQYFLYIDQEHYEEGYTVDHERGTKRFRDPFHYGSAYYVKAHFGLDKPSFECISYALFAFRVDAPALANEAADGYTTNNGATDVASVNDFMMLWTGDTPYFSMTEIQPQEIHTFYNNPSGILFAHGIGPHQTWGEYANHGVNSSAFINNSLVFNSSQLSFTHAPWSYPVEGYEFPPGSTVSAPGWNTISHSNTLNFGFPRTMNSYPLQDIQDTGDINNINNPETLSYELEFKFWNLKLLHIAIIPEWHNKKYYVDIGGRIKGYEGTEDTGANPRAIIEDILKEEVGLDNSVVDNNFLSGNYFVDGTKGEQSIYLEDDGEVVEDIPWQYAFTINSEIDSKKLIEDFCKHTQLFTYFRNNKMYMFPLKKIYDPINDARAKYIISSRQIKSYSFSKTDINTVYSEIEFRYGYDHATQSYLKSTNLLASDEFPDHDPTLYGFTSYGTASTNKIEIIESKYINDVATARDVARYLLALHCNQHNIIDLELGLEFMYFNVGDLVRFKQNDLINNEKCFGENYTNTQYNVPGVGQTKYNLWLITSIQKNEKGIKVSLYQLHNLKSQATLTATCQSVGATNFDPDGDYHDEDLCEYAAGEDIITGCTIEGATNYNPGAIINDGSCEFEGCTSPDALNYDPNATQEATPSSCIFTPPALSAPSELKINGVTIDNNFLQEVESGSILGIGVTPGEMVTFQYTMPDSNWKFFQAWLGGSINFVENNQIFSVDVLQNPGNIIYNQSYNLVNDIDDNTGIYIDPDSTEPTIGHISLRGYYPDDPFYLVSDGLQYSTEGVSQSSWFEISGTNFIPIPFYIIEEEPDPPDADYGDVVIENMNIDINVVEVDGVSHQLEYKLSLWVSGEDRGNFQSFLSGEGVNIPWWDNPNFATGTTNGILLGQVIVYGNFALNTITGVTAGTFSTESRAARYGVRGYIDMEFDESSPDITDSSLQKYVYIGNKYSRPMLEKIHVLDANVNSFIHHKTRDMSNEYFDSNYDNWITNVGDTIPVYVHDKNISTINEPGQGDGTGTDYTFNDANIPHTQLPHKSEILSHYCMLSVAVKDLDAFNSEALVSIYPDNDELLSGQFTNLANGNVSLKHLGTYIIHHEAQISFVYNSGINHAKIYPYGLYGDWSSNLDILNGFLFRIDIMYDLDRINNLGTIAQQDGWFLIDYLEAFHIYMESQDIDGWETIQWEFSGTGSSPSEALLTTEYLDVPGLDDIYPEFPSPTEAFRLKMLSYATTDGNGNITSLQMFNENGEPVNYNTISFADMYNAFELLTEYLIYNQ